MHVNSCLSSALCAAGTLCPAALAGLGLAPAGPLRAGASISGSRRAGAGDLEYDENILRGAVGVERGEVNVQSYPGIFCFQDLTSQGATQVVRQGAAMTAYEPLAE